MGDRVRSPCRQISGIDQHQVLYQQVKEVLEVNKAQRHIRGGIATRKKYRGE